MKWQARIEDQKNIVKLRKVEVRAEFRKKMGLVIDQPRVGGPGSSNNGNIAKRFFKQHDLSANIMNMDADLMKRLYINLATRSCGYDINSSKFKAFCWETVLLYVDLYLWYPMAQILHKILIGYEVIELFTWKKTILNLFHLLCVSDPLICTFRKKIDNKKKVYRLVSLNYCKSQRQNTLRKILI